MTCRRFAAAGRSGMSRIPIVPIQSSAAEESSTSSDRKRTRPASIAFIISGDRIFRRADSGFSLLQRRLRKPDRARDELDLLQDRRSLASVFLRAALRSGDPKSAAQKQTRQNDWLAEPRPLSSAGIFIVGQGIEYWQLFQRVA